MKEWRTYTHTQIVKVILFLFLMNNFRFIFFSETYSKLRLHWKQKLVKKKVHLSSNVRKELNESYIDTSGVLITVLGRPNEIENDLRFGMKTMCESRINKMSRPLNVFKFYKWQKHEPITNINVEICQEYIQAYFKKLDFGYYMWVIQLALISFFILLY